MTDRTRIRLRPSEESEAPEDVLKFPTEARTPDPDAYPLAASLRGFGPLGILAILIIVLSGNVVVGDMVVAPVGAPLALLWTWRSRTPWRAIGYARPRSWTNILLVGLVFGTIFAVTGRIWMLMCAHTAFDLTALGIIYWDLESDVAHLVF